jgi:hypothetical protein
MQIIAKRRKIEGVGVAKRLKGAISIAGKRLKD